MATAGGGVGVQNGISANFNLAWNSVITSKIGYASSVLSHVGGARLKGITDTIADSTDRFIETYCKEISLRQKQASGLTYARAIFVFNAGQNGGDDDSDNDWTLYTQEACQKIKNAWIAVGESNDNLAFRFLTSLWALVIELSTNSPRAYQGVKDMLLNILRAEASGLTSTEKAIEDDFSPLAAGIRPPICNYYSGLAYHPKPAGNGQELHLRALP